MVRTYWSHARPIGGQARLWGSGVALLLYLLAMPAAPAAVVGIERISPPPLDLEVPLPVSSPVISADGHFIVFVAGETSKAVFVRDRQTRATELVSIGPDGAPAHGNSSAPVISADGRFVAFVANGQLYVRDRQSERTEPAGDGTFEPPAISADGRFVAFASFDTDLVSGFSFPECGCDPPPYYVFVRDRQTGKTELVSVSPSGAPVGVWTQSPTISADGRFVAFLSGASNLVSGETHPGGGTYLRDRQSGKTEFLPGGSAALSGDGRFVAFVADSSNFVPGSTSNPSGVYVRDRQTDRTEFVSVSSTGELANGSSASPAISTDGRFVVFWSSATNVAPGGASGRPGIYVRDRQAGKTEWVGDAASYPPTDRSDFPSVSDDGRFVAFSTSGPLYVRDRVTGSTEVITASVNARQTTPDSDPPAISGDGQWVEFAAAGQVFERNLITGAAALVSVSPDGAPAHGRSWSPAISADGRFVAFVSTADNLVPQNTNGQWNIFLRDRQTGKIELVSIGIGDAPANSISLSPSISADGRNVAFASAATNLVPGSTSGSWNIFVRDRQTGTTALVNAGVSGPQNPELSGPPAISADGRFVAFTSFREGNYQNSIYVWDRTTGSLELASVTTSRGPANGNSDQPTISADGRLVAFWSEAANLMGGDAGGWQIYVRDRQSGNTELVSVETNGKPAFAATHSAAISADGRFVAFVSWAPGPDPGGGRGIFVRDRQLGKTELLSLGMGGAPANGWSDSPAISADGRFIAFASDADNLARGDTNGSTDVFVAERN